MRTSLALLALSLFGLPACSALGLADLPQADCVQGSGGMSGDAFCASLSVRIPPDACRSWQCNEQSHHCEQLPIDEDADGAPSMMCAPAGVTPDCNDSIASNHPGGMETCDGLDQNCDGIADDGAIVESVMLSSLSTTTGTAVSQTYQPDSDEAYLLSWQGTAFRGTTITATATPADLVFTQTGTGALAPSGAQGAISALGSQRYALAMRRLTPNGMAVCEQWSVFPARSGTGAVTLRAIDQTLLPACPAVDTAQRVTAPAIAGHPVAASPTSDVVLVAWLTGLDDLTGNRGCGVAPSRTVMVSGALLNDRTPSASRVSTEVLTLGDSVGDGPPVVLALDDAFLVAYARADMTIAVHLISVTVDSMTQVHLSPSTPSPLPPTYVEPAGAMVLQNVTLARGETTSGSTPIALAYTTGCSGTNPITVRMLTHSASGLTASSTATLDLGSGPTRGLLTLAHQSRADDWILGWRSGTGIWAQRLLREGAPEGDPFVLGTSTTVNTFLIEPLATGPLYRAIIADGSNQLNQITFGCAAP